MEVLVLGGSGLVGTEVLKQLSADLTFTKIVAAVRRPLTQPVPPRVDQRSLDLLAPDLPLDLYPETVFCCIGTTLKDAGGREAFWVVDHDMPIAAARAARKRGARHFIVISAMGADPRAAVFYNRVKGEMESELKALNYPLLTIIHPSLLLGKRPRLRIKEEIAAVFMKLFAFAIPTKYRAVEARKVAAVMIESARDPRKGVRLINNDEILQHR